MPQIIDSQNRAAEALIATETVAVTDPLTGAGRKVIAGQPVPPGLEDAYRIALAKGKRASTAKE